VKQPATWLEKRGKHSLLRQSGMYFLGRTVPAIISFAALALYTRLLTPEQYGLYAIVTASVTLTFYISLLWLCSSAVRLLEAAADRVVLRAVLLLAYLGVVAVVGIACVPLYWLRSDYQLLVLLGFVLFAAQGWLELNLHLLSAALMADRYMRLSLIRSVASTAIGGTLALAGWGASGVLTGAVAGVLLPGVWLLWTEWRFNPLRRLNRAVVRATLAYGLPLSVSFSLAGLLQNADRLLLGWLAAPAALGIYAAAFDLVNRTLRALMDPIASAGLPLAVRALERAGQSAARQQLRSNLVLLMAVGLPATLGLVMVSPDLCRLLLGSDFRDEAAPVASIVAIGTFLALVRATYLDHAFQLGRRTFLLGVTIAGAASTSIGLNLWLIPLLGAIGAACATVLAHTVGFGLAIGLGRRSFPLPLPVGDLLKIAAASAVMCLVVLVMPADGSLRLLALQITVGALVYSAVAVILNAAAIRSRVFTYAFRYPSRPR
jgi:O-antigen/teichoic acid export membrane protein